MYYASNFGNNTIGDFMKIRLGYVSITKTLDITPSSNVTYTEFLKNNDFNKLDKVIISNFNNLEKLINYNIANNIHFYRLTSKLIPLATKNDVIFDYLEKYRFYYEKIGEKIKNMRVDFHPDQFCVLNSTKSEVVENSYSILKYHYDILTYLGILDKVIILHIGSSVLGKDNSIRRFINNFKKLDKCISDCIVIENDDKVFNILDCIKIKREIGCRIVLDYHHFNCNNNKENLLDHIDEIFDGWYIPKIHFSSPKNKTKKDFRSHHDYINVFEFIAFIELIKHLEYDIDIMIEAKAKDEAVFRLVRQLKYYTNYKFIDETTFIV